MNTTTVTVWLLTYLVHSSLLLGAAWLVSRLLGERHLALQESVLRAALAAGVLTATFQTVVGVLPMTGVVALDIPPAAAGPVSAAAVLDHNAPITGLAVEGGGSAIRWSVFLPAVWALGAALALVGILRSWLDLRRLLRSRCLRPAGRLVDGLASAMGLRRQVALSTSKAIPVPFATGIRQPEICCPERIDELAREHRTSLFAHEVAHLARRDPAWQLGYRLLEAILFVQPLNRCIRRRLEEIAEHLTDERAAACTGDRLGLARCLVVIAHWGQSSSIGIPATALAAGPRLDSRVKRLLSGALGRGTSSPWALPVALTACVASVAVLPAVATDPPSIDPATSSIQQADIWTFAGDESSGLTLVSGSRTWSIIDERPEEAPEAPPAPAAPPAHEAPPPAVPGNPTEPSPAPPAAAEPRSASPAPAAPRSPVTEPAPQATPEPTAAPEPPARPSQATAEEKARRREEARQRAREHARHSERTAERHRAEAKARAREQEERSRERAERSRERAEAMARATRMDDREREELQRHVRELHAEARRMSSEEARAQRERARAVAAEARALEREAALKAGGLSDERVEELRRRATELAAEAQARHRESARVHREEARALSEEARRLAEEAERKRLEEIEKETKKKPQ